MALRRSRERLKKKKCDLLLMTYLDQGKEHLSSAMSIPRQLEHGNTSTMCLQSLPAASVAN